MDPSMGQRQKRLQEKVVLHRIYFKMNANMLYGEEFE